MKIKLKKFTETVKGVYENGEIKNRKLVLLVLWTWLEIKSGKKK